jgi:hypothetical protein
LAQFGGLRTATFQGAQDPTILFHSMVLFLRCLARADLDYRVPQKHFAARLKIISGGQTGANRAGLDFAIETGLEHGGYVPRGRKAEDGRIDDRYNLIELSNSSYPARTKRNIEKSDGTVIFSLERVLSGGTKLTLELANTLGKPLLHIYDTRKERISNPDSLCLEIQALSDSCAHTRSKS